MKGAILAEEKRQQQFPFEFLRISAFHLSLLGNGPMTSKRPKLILQVQMV